MSKKPKALYTFLKFIYVSTNMLLYLLAHTLENDSVYTLIDNTDSGILYFYVWFLCFFNLLKHKIRFSLEHNLINYVII